MQVTDAIFDPELGCTAFTVERITYTRSRSGTTSRSETAQARGGIHPGTPEMIQLLPEEEKNETFIAIYTDYALSTGTPEDAAPSVDASSIVAAPHSGDGSFQMTSHSEGISATGGLGMFARIRQAQQKIASKKVGEVSVTYATGASSSSGSVHTDLADLPETSFGLQLLSLLKMYGRSFYVP